MIEELLSLKSTLPTGTVRKAIPEGMAGTEATLDEMRKCVDQGKRDKRIRTLAGQIIQDVPEKDYEGYARAIHDWIRTNIKYAFDPAGVETIEWPAQILDIKIADCDSSAILNAALNESIGLESRFRAIKANRNNQDEFSHIWSEVYIPQKGWMASDCTMPKGFGWRPPDHYGAKNWPASHDKYENHDGDHMASLRGLNGLGDLTTTWGIIEAVYDGTIRQQINDWQASLAQQTKDLTELNAAAYKITDPTGQAQAVAMVRQGREIVGNGQQQISALRQQLNFIAGELNRIPGVSIASFNAGMSGLSGLGAEFGTLSGMGMLPAAVVAGLVDVGIVLGFAAAAILIIEEVASAIRGGDGVITQLRKFVESFGVVITDFTSSITTLAMVAAGGFALWMGYKFLLKKGKV